MSETVAIIVAGASLIVGVIRETQFRKQRANQQEADTAVSIAAAALSDASAADTITTTVKGLLITLDERLKATQAELEESRREWHLREREMQDEIDTLKAKVTVLMESKARGER